MDPNALNPDEMNPYTSAGVSAIAMPVFAAFQRDGESRSPVLPLDHVDQLTVRTAAAVSRPVIEGRGESAPQETIRDDLSSLSSDELEVSKSPAQEAPTKQPLRRPPAAFPTPPPSAPAAKTSSFLPPIQGAGKRNLFVKKAWE